MSKKKIRLIELFAGIGATAKALRNIGVNFEHYKAVELDKYAVKSYNAIHGTNFKTSDITQIKGSDLGIVDTDKFTYIMTYSFPCGLAKTKIITQNGYKNIENIREGDMVLTHNNRYCKVNKIMSRTSNHYYELKGLGVPQLYLTEEHPLYVLRDNKEQWVKVKDLKTTDYFGFNVNQESKDVDLSNEYLWLLGRYVADGFINKHLYNSVLFAIGNDKEQQFLGNIPVELKDRFKTYNKSCIEYRVADKDLQELCLQFGNGALNKCVPNWIFDLPKEKLQSFFNGYISGDGHIRTRGGTRQIMFATVSEDLFLSMQRIVAKLYGAVCSCYIRHDNRKETFNDTYNCQFNVSDFHRDQIILNDKIYTKIRHIKRVDKSVPVYNFEVDRDNSYTCQNVNVHNCQDLSTAGLRLGMSNNGTNSGLLWEVKRLLSETKELPQILLMENVVQIHSKKNINDFNRWIEFLESKGYSNYWQDLNAKDYGTPQNRDRCFMVSKLNNTPYTFPNPVPLDKCLLDILEDKVADIFYLGKKTINLIKDNDGQLNTMKDKQVNRAVVTQVGNIIKTGNYSNPQRGRVYDPHGICPTLATVSGGGLQHKILTPDNRIRKLTPKEYWRLMNFSDEDYNKAKRVNFATQMYKQAGNSICVHVLEEIFKNLTEIH